MYELLKEGNILHCDLDAIWLKDARKLLDDEHDIIASRKMKEVAYQKHTNN